LIQGSLLGAGVLGRVDCRAGLIGSCQAAPVRWCLRGVGGRERLCWALLASPRARLGPACGPANGRARAPPQRRRVCVCVWGGARGLRPSCSLCGCTPGGKSRWAHDTRGHGACPWTGCLALETTKLAGGWGEGWGAGQGPGARPHL
jgi:hypothetical protein